MDNLYFDSDIWFSGLYTVPIGGPEDYHYISSDYHATRTLNSTGDEGHDNVSNFIEDYQRPTIHAGGYSPIDCGDSE